MSFLIEQSKRIQLKSFQIPILVIGTKADLVDDAERLKQLSRGGNIGRILFIELLEFYYSFIRFQLNNAGQMSSV